MNETPGKKAVTILCVCVLLYIPVQWIAGRRPGATSIFSTRHREMKQNFLEETAALRQQLLFQCAHRGVHDIYLTDGDVISPFLVSEVQAQPGCVLRRETLVTPREDAPKLVCSALIVDEGMPSAWNPVHLWDYLGTLHGQVATVSRFESGDKQFNFMLLQARRCAHTGVPAGLADPPLGPDLQ